MHEIKIWKKSYHCEAGHIISRHLCNTQIVRHTDPTDTHKLYMIRYASNSVCMKLTTFRDFNIDYGLHNNWMKWMAFLVMILHWKAILGRGQLGLMRWILFWINNSTEFPRICVLVKQYNIRAICQTTASFNPLYVSTLQVESAIWSLHNYFIKALGSLYIAYNTTFIQGLSNRKLHPYNQALLHDTLTFYDNYKI